MAKLAVYYFSGTGNTLFLAKVLSTQLGGEMIPIVSSTGVEVVRPDADIIGIVYPVYYNDLPVIVREFAQKLRDIDRRYIFGVCNYGGCGSQSMKTLGELIRAAGGELASAFGIHMPQNASYKAWEINNKLIEKAGAKTAKIAEMIKAGKKGIFLKSLLDAVFIRMHTRLIPKVKASLAEKSGLPRDTALDILIRSADKSFHTNGKCVGCRLCAKVCPVGNIKISGGKPTWHGHCENCLACYDWCPQKAIEGGVASKGYYYINPKISASDIMAQKIL